MEQQTVDEQFNEIYDKTYRYCLIFVTSKCSNTQDISDILQETYLSLYRILAQKGRAYIQNPEAYVIRIAKSKIYKYYSLQDKLKCFIPLFRENEEGEEYMEESLNSDLLENSLENVVVEKESLDKIWQLLKKKPQGVQKVFFLFYYADLSIPEIAQRLKLNESTVKNWIYRTTQEFRQSLEMGGVSN